jgi:hypothetical protein
VTRVADVGRMWLVSAVRPHACGSSRPPRGRRTSALGCAHRPLVHREHLTSLQAFALLLKTSQNANIKLVERPDDTTATEEASKDPDPQN